MGCSPDNWPTVWLSPDGSMQHRLKTNEILDDYLNKDLVPLGDSSITQPSQYESTLASNSRPSLEHLPTLYEQLVSTKGFIGGNKSAALNNSREKWQVQLPKDVSNTVEGEERSNSVHRNLIRERCINPNIPKPQSLRY